MLNTVPFGTSLFDQPQILLEAMATCRNVYRTAQKNIKDYDSKNDYTVKRIVDIMKMQDWQDTEQYKRRLQKICGDKVLENGRINIPLLEDMDLGMVIGDIVRKVGGDNANS